MLIKPIRTDQDHTEALARITEIFNAKPGMPEFDELDVLGTLVDAYEKVRWPIDPPSPVEALKFYIDQGRFTRADLTKLLGGAARTAEILNERRALSKAMIVKLHRTYAIPLESLFTETERTPKPRTLKPRRAA